MFVRITRGYPNIEKGEGPWWSNRVGEVHEVVEIPDNPHSFITDKTHYKLVHSIPGEEFAQYISKSDCEPVDYNTNKGVSFLLEEDD